jgi:hypothetical protein
MAVLADGSVSVNDGASNAQQEIAEVTKVTSPNTKVQFIDGSYLGMSSNVKNLIPGLQDPQEISFECNYISNTAERLEALRGVTKTWIIGAATEGAETKTWTFSGVLSGYESNFDVGAVAKISAMVQITGAPTFA